MKITAITKFKQGDIYLLLKKLGWSQHELARRAGITDQSIGKICNLNFRPSSKNANKIQRAFAEQGEFIDILSLWPESFIGLERGSKLEQTKEIDSEILVSMNREALQIPFLDNAREKEELILEINEEIEKLPDRNREIFTDYLNNSDNDDSTLRNTGEKFGISYQRVNQICKESARKIRKQLNQT